jgi:fructokinase
VIVVSGEALMDVFDAGRTATGALLDARIGGSPLNVAIGLARLGQPVAFFGALSKGFLGERLLHALREEGVETGSCVRLAAPTTLGLVGLDARGVADYAFYGDGAADRLLGADALAAVPAGALAYQFGSYAMVVGETARTQRALVERESGRGGSTSVIAYDPNVRLNVEPDLAVWRSALAWMLPHTHLLKLSDEDFERLFPGQAFEALAARWLAAHDDLGLVVLTRGAQGALAFGRSAGRVEAAPIAAKVVDTVGAGDTFQAATLAALAERQRLQRGALAALSAADLQAVLDFATRAAAITCSRRGADLPRRSELA